MDEAEELFATAFEEFSKRDSSSSLSGCYQLLLVPRSKIIANL
jgi:hypothetical protein